MDSLIKMLGIENKYNELCESEMYGHLGFLDGVSAALKALIKWLFGRCDKHEHLNMQGNPCSCIRIKCIECMAELEKWK